MLRRAVCVKCLPPMLSQLLKSKEILTRILQNAFAGVFLPLVAPMMLWTPLWISETGPLASSLFCVKAGSILLG